MDIDKRLREIDTLREQNRNERIALIKEKNAMVDRIEALVDEDVKLGSEQIELMELLVSARK